MNTEIGPTAAAQGEKLMHVLRRLRTDRVLTQAALAQAAGITPTTVSRLERGAGPRPSFTTVRKLAQALKVEPQVLNHAHAGDDASSPDASAGGQR